MSDSGSWLPPTPLSDSGSWLPPTPLSDSGSWLPPTPLSDSGSWPPPAPPSVGSTSPDAEGPWWKTWWFVGGAIAILILIVGLVAAGAGGGDDAAPETTSGVSEATVAAPGTSEAPNTTEAAPETSVPSSDYLGIVWESAEDPERVNSTEERPEFVDGPMSAEIDVYLITPGPDDSQFCADVVDESFETPPEVVSCFQVQWRFDVSDVATETAYMSAAEAVTADGRQVEPLYSDFIGARPGTVENLASAIYPNLGPGSRIFLSYSAESADDFIFGDWEVVVPDAFQPIDWFDD